MRNSMGVMRNQTHVLLKYKENQRQQDNVSKEINPIKPNSHLLESSNGSSDSTGSNFSIELTTKQQIYEWSPYYDDTLMKLKQVQDKSIEYIREQNIRELQILGTKRIKLQFGDSSSLEKQIYDNNNKATKVIIKYYIKLIIECEQNIELISKYFSEDETQSEQRIRINIQKALAQQIQELTNQLRNQQKRMVNLIRSIHKDEGGEFLKLSQQKQNEMQAQELTQDEEQLYDDTVVGERDQEIDKLVRMINELADVFKSLNQLVVDQGSILDRIDCNIESTFENVKKANVQLRKAEEDQKSPMARRCIIFLVVLIAICSVLLAVKYSK